jgi:DMSO/TMAO reductase YedYZ molybdopterin-dependent catalytic subunit
MDRGPSRRAALAGVLAVAGGVAASEAVSGLLHVRASPVVAVAEEIIEITPGGIAEWFIHLVGRNDKHFLIAGVLIGLILVGAVCGLAARHRRAWGVLILGLVGLVGVIGEKTRAHATILDTLPAIAAALVAITLLNWLLNWAGDNNPKAYLNDAGISRRAFLIRSGMAAAGAVVLASTGRFLSHSRDALEAARRNLRLPVRAAREPAGVSVGVAGVSPWLTPVGDFYRIDTSLAPPLLNPKDWQLRIHGMVRKELTLSFQDLLSRDLTDAWVTLCCVSNNVGGPLIGNAHWSGVRVADLLAEAGVEDGADAVLSTSTDGWTAGTPMEALTDDRNAMLALAMDGQPLPIEHGFPVRMVVPGLYGFVSATKWLVDLEVTQFSKFTAYWTDRGWSAQAPVKTSSRIDVPRSGNRVGAGTVPVGGVAWAQHRGITAVEVRVDDGDWQTATLGREPTIDSWVQWRFEWQASAGDHTLTVRAIDGDGVVQSGADVGVVPNGAEGYHSVSVSVDSG